MGRAYRGRLLSWHAPAWGVQREEHAPGGTRIGERKATRPRSLGEDASPTTHAFLWRGVLNGGILA